MVLERLAHGALYLTQSEWLGSGSFAERIRQSRNHEPVRFLAEREGTRFAAGADDTAGSAGEADQMLGLAAVCAGGELGREAGDERQLQPEGEGRFELCRPRLGRIVKERQVAAEEVVGRRGGLGRVEQAQDRV